MTMEISPTLEGLVRIYSPSGSETKAVEFILQRMQALGYDQAFRDEAGNAVGIVGSGDHQIILLGHIDTVPGEIPFRIEDNILYGRGSVDAKGPLSTFTDAAAALGPRSGWQVIVIGAVDEERDSKGAWFLTTQPQYHPEFVIIGEPSSWQKVTLGYKGAATLQLTARASQTHTAANDLTACDLAHQAWVAVLQYTNEYNQENERIFDQLQLTLLNMTSDSDNFENTATLTANLRIPLGITASKFLEDVRQLLPEDVTLETLGRPIPPHRSEKNTPLVRAFLQSIRTAGGSPSFSIKTGTADGNIVAPVWDCPLVTYGPGDSSLDHTPNEHLSLEEYQLAVQVLHSTLRTITA